MLPVGGVRDKVLAARRGGIRHVLLPARNRGDLEELPAEAAEGLRFTFLDTIGDVLFALFPASSSSAAAGTGDRVDPSPPHSSRAEEAPGDEAGGGAGGRSQGFHTVHGHGNGHGHTFSRSGGGRGADAGRGGVGGGGGGGWEAEDVSAALLESFL